ncbi:bifunctional glycosyltransferase/CDP-glycerol:glycerophosphate glycerophosphotransferase [Streptomyces sp. MUM 178J]|uniref:bifunctional glycosyltransferase/CDP-glycerol:glycerophosphate glycerophosphotransferase n=1 Tax=Streptomyces sp. MUM 178J TaxID=2791991 RepID=UPI001F048953|nr:bifunctional glycosyltransferase/CDP-glycerol:glycerophosphate glycerophosphotransferase [Streptomyces sp. MUM 178J]WRQ79760.1 CDP-glycerol glycerophosphotransferase family protein [Streptomyces sp. MUM 178J]
MSKPRISVIVPIYQVQSFLRECLDSILEQSFRDIEVIAVNDRSPDRCGEIVDEYAEADERVRALHLPENVGLGRARNAGMEIARGDYLFFLDSDDTLTPGSLQLIADRLAQTSDPDVLIFDYARTFWWGAATRNSLASVFQMEGPEVFTAKQRPEFLNLLMVVWNKVYRRDFVEQRGFQFPPGYYEDTPWTFPVLMSADRIAALDHVVVHYRQRRQGNILRTVSRKHFDIFDQYERVFTFMDSDPSLAEWRARLFTKMIDHFIAILAKSNRVPNELRSEFFALAHRHYRRYLPADYVRPDGHTGLRHALIARGAYPVYQTLKVANQGRRKVRKTVRASRKKVAGKRLDRHYEAALKQPIDENLAVYSAYWGRGYVCNPAALHAKAKEIAPHIKGVVVAKQDEVKKLPPGTDFVIPGTARYWEVMARAKYFFNNVNFEDRFVKRPGTVHVQTQHGTPLKRMGIHMLPYPVAAKGTNFRKLLQRSDRWDFCISSNRFSSEIWEQAFPCSFAPLESGYPRNDVFYNSTADDVRRLRDELGIPQGKIAVLYAPTHRDYTTGFVPQLDLARLTDTLGDGFVVLMRGHHFYEQTPELQALQASARVIDVTSHTSSEELQLAADVLLADYSSMMFDYANLDRPIVIYANDWDAYTVSRGVYFDLLEEPPGHVARTQDELHDIFVSGAWKDERSDALRGSFRRKFCEYDDGRASERVIRQILLGEPAEKLPVVPLDERTPAPSPTAAQAESMKEPAVGQSRAA